MTRYYSNVNISSGAATCKIGPFATSTIIGNGNAVSNDKESLQKMSEELTSAVDSNNERVYKLQKRLLR